MDGSHTPCVSILLPVRNGWPYLPRCLDSIRAQTIADWELVVVDDGADSASVGELTRMAGQDSRVRIMRMPEHRGVSDALNYGLQYCRGEFVARMDADDVCVPQRLERQRDFLRQNIQVLAVGCWTLRIDSDGDPIGLSRWSCEHLDIEQELLEGRGGVPHPGAMIRATAMAAVHGYRPEFPYAQDKDLWLRLSELGRLANLPEMLLHYREHGANVSMQHHREQRECVGRAVQDARERRNLPIGPAQSSYQPRAITERDRRIDWVRGALRAKNLPTCRKHLTWLAKHHPFSFRVRMLTLRLWRAEWAAARGAPKWTGRASC